MLPSHASWRNWEAQTYSNVLQSAVTVTRREREKKKNKWKRDKEEERTAWMTHGYALQSAVTVTLSEPPYVDGCDQVIMWPLVLKKCEKCITVPLLWIGLIFSTCPGLVDVVRMKLWTTSIAKFIVVKMCLDQLIWLVPFLLLFYELFSKECFAGYQPFCVHLICLSSVFPSSEKKPVIYSGDKNSVDLLWPSANWFIYAFLLQKLVKFPACESLVF